MFVPEFPEMGEIREPFGVSEWGELTELRIATWTPGDLLKWSNAVNHEVAIGTAEIMRDLRVLEGPRDSGDYVLSAITPTKAAVTTEGEQPESAGTYFIFVESEAAKRRSRYLGNHVLRGEI